MGDAIVYKSEADVKKQVRLLLDLIGAFVFMPPANAYGRAGISDFIGVHRGRFFAIEAKFGRNTPTAMQLRFGASVIEHGGIFLVINEMNVGDVWTIDK